MLKKVSVILLATLLFACASQPTEKGFKGTGDFDTAEAAKTRVSLGLTYLKNGNFSQAKFNLDKALEFAPRSGEANYAMAFYYQQVDEVERAHEYYKKAISLSRNAPDITNSYGAFLCKQGDYEQAKKYFLQSIDDKSYISTASTYENLAICSQNQGKIEEAILYFNSALNHQPTRASSLLYVTQLYVQTQRWDDAKKSLWKYERNANVTDESLWLSFQIARGQNNLRSSIEYAEILKRLHPNSPNTKKAINALGKFQPDMTVTQKTRNTSQNKQNTYTDNTLEQGSTNNDNKVTRVLAPAIDTSAPITTVSPITKTSDEAKPVATEEVPLLTEQAPILIEEEPDLIDMVDAAPDLTQEEYLVLETQTNVENETELALKEALDNTDALSQSAVKSSVAIEVNNDKVSQKVSQEEVIDPSEASQETLDDEMTDPQISEGTPFHIVQAKENLYRISLKYNVKIKKLLEWNKLADESSIRIGTKLWVRNPNINE